jgi:hypothetical protein
VTGAFYLVTEWREDSDDQIVAREKEELSDAEVVDRLGDDLPDEWREQIEADLWKEVSDEPP